MTSLPAERQVPPLVYPPPGRADLDALVEDDAQDAATTITIIMKA